jgi:UDP-2,3-diacylglucosamine pyrophosphatase LpxH
MDNEVPTEVKIVVSDLHLGTGTRPGEENPYEDFYQDERFEEMLAHYSEGVFTDIPVELIINGDFLDLLKVPYKGQFVTEITEDIALDKVRRCIRGHKKVFDALASFVSKPNHKVTYIAGNHDLDIAFPKVQALLRARLGLEDGADALKFVVEEDYYRLPSGIVVTHGHTFEEMNRIEPRTPLIEREDGTKVVNMPWGSKFFANVIAPAKSERRIIDLVQPLSSFILWGLFFDMRFTLSVLWRIILFFLHTRVKNIYERELNITKTLQIVGEEFAFYNNLERRASTLLRESQDIRVLIVGHSHNPRFRRYPQGKIYVNSGTWVQRVSLDLNNLGTSTILTYVECTYYKGRPPIVRLLRWRGKLRTMEEVVF